MNTLTLKYLLRLALGLAIPLWVISTAGCTDETASRRALESAGYTNITFTGHEVDDVWRGFEAIGPSGKRVDGAVGCGYTGCSKGCTIRLH